VLRPAGQPGLTPAWSVTLAPSEAARPEILLGVGSARDARAGVLVVDGSASDWEAAELVAADAAIDLLAALDCVIVGVLRGDPPPPGRLLDGCDLLAVTPVPAAASGWNFEGSPPELDAWVGGVMDRVAQLGLPAVAAGRLLRMSAQLDVGAGLVAESLAYSMLQAGPAHRAWLRTRPASPGGAA
jgi:hypothetical protein